MLSIYEECVRRRRKGDEAIWCQWKFRMTRGGSRASEDNAVRRWDSAVSDGGHFPCVYGS